MEMTFVNDVVNIDPDDGWQEPRQQTFRVHLLTIKEDDGAYSTIALNLPGAGSCAENPSAQDGNRLARR